MRSRWRMRWEWWRQVRGLGSGVTPGRDPYQILLLDPLQQRLGVGIELRVREDVVAAIDGQRVRAVQESHEKMDGLLPELVGAEQQAVEEPLLRL